MPWEEKRRSQRYQAPPTSVALCHGASRKEGALVDLSQTGAFLKGCSAPRGDTHISICIPRYKAIERNGTVVRWDTEHALWCAVHFQEPLSEYDLSVILRRDADSVALGATKPVGLASSDLGCVRQEIIDVKSCRTTTFLWMWAGIAAGTMAIWTLAIDDKIGPKAALAGTGIILGIFVIGSLSLLEKARAIHLREGFLAALSGYLSHNEAPVDYQGWNHLRSCFEECGARRRLHVCSRRVRSHIRATCRDEGEAKAAALNSAKHLIPSVLGSFTSLSAFICVILYTAMICLFGYALAKTWQEIWQLGTLGNVLLSLLAGAGASLIAARYKGSSIVAACALGLSFVGATFHESQIWAFISAGLSGLLMGLLGWFYLRQLIEIRTGRFSFESYLYSWRAVLEHCVPFPSKLGGHDVYSEPGVMARMLSAILRWILKVRNHRRVRADFEEAASAAPEDTARQS